MVVHRACSFCLHRSSPAGVEAERIINLKYTTEMHILEIPSFFPPYGGLFCLDQSKALAMYGNTVRIAACVETGLSVTPKHYFTAPLCTHHLKMDGIDVVRHYMRAIPKCHRRNVERWLGIVEKIVDNYVERYGKPDMLHAHCCKWAGYAAMKAGEKYGLPYVITEHLPSGILATEFQPGTGAWQEPMLREAYSRAAMVIPVAAELVADTAPYFGTGYRWQEVSNTIDVDFFTYKERERRDGQPFVFCCIADFIPRKGYDVLARAMQKFIADTHANVRLVVAGRGTDSQEMKQLLHGCGLEGRVDMCGSVDKYGVLQILHGSHCLLLASRSEVQPLVLLEAMSTGIPVVSTEVVPCSERVEGGCFIAGVDDADGFAQCMKQVYGGAAADGRKLSAAISAMASPEVVGRRLTDLFEDVCQSFGGNEQGSCRES